MRIYGEKALLELLFAMMVVFGVFIIGSIAFEVVNNSHLGYVDDLQDLTKSQDNQTIYADEAAAKLEHRFDPSFGSLDVKRMVEDSDNLIRYNNPDEPQRSHIIEYVGKQ